MSTPCPQWRRVASWSGAATKSTERFAVSGEWKIVWETSPGELGPLNFQIFIHDESGGLAAGGLVANVIGPNADESYCYQAGTFYLELAAMQPYVVSVWERR